MPPTQCVWLLPLARVAQCTGHPHHVHCSYHGVSWRGGPTLQLACMLQCGCTHRGCYTSTPPAQQPLQRVERPDTAACILTQRVHPAKPSTTQSCDGALCAVVAAPTGAPGDGVSKDRRVDSRICRRRGAHEPGAAAGQCEPVLARPHAQPQALSTAVRAQQLQQYQAGAGGTWCWCR